MFDIYTCRNCDFSFTQDYPDELSIGRYYRSENYISHTDTNKNIIEKLYRKARNLMLSRKRELVTGLCRTETGTILDIGSGTGHFVNFMSRSGWDSTGIEIDEKAREYSVTKLGIKVLPPDKISSLPTEGFDCISLWHTLEHFHDPEWYFSEINRLLKDNGKVIVALPNSGSYDCRHYGADWAAWDVPRHLWHFNPQTFTDWAEKRGYSVITKKYLPLDVFYISILTEKQIAGMMALPKGIVKALWFTLLSLINRDRGSSLAYVLARKIN